MLLAVQVRAVYDAYPESFASSTHFPVGLHEDCVIDKLLEAWSIREKTTGLCHAFGRME